MKKVILISLCVLFVAGATVFGTTYSYTISGKVKAAGVGVNAASVSHYVTWSSGANSGGGIGPTLADGSFSANMSQSGESYINRTMQLLASKGQMSGSKSWTCAASSEIKDVDIYLNVNVDPDLRYGGGPIHFAGETLVAPSTQFAYVQPGYSGETQLQSFTVTLAYDPTQLYTEVPAVAPMQPYSFFDVLIPVPGTIEIHAEVDPMGPPLLLGDMNNPIPLYEIMWTATNTGTQHITSVQTEMIEMNLGPTPPGSPVEAVPHTTEHLVGDAETCKKTFVLDSAEEWQEALDSEWPQRSLSPILESEWVKFMEAWADPCSEKEGEPYPENEFLPAELWVYDGGGSGGYEPNDAGLVMYWGNESTPDGNYATAFRYDYGMDPDLRNSIIKVTVTAPQWGVTGQQVTAVSFAINDIAGLRCWWWWNCGAPGSGQPIIWNQPTTVTIDTTIVGINAATPTATGYVRNAGFNLAKAQSFDVDENFQWIFQPVNVPPPGQPTFVGMWNYWHNLLVVNKTPPVAVASKYYVKWSQRPNVIDANDPKIFLGWDEKSDFNNPPIVADDWKCEDDRPVTDIHWWGSFIGWNQPSPPPILPKLFHIGIWTDVPDPDPCDPVTFSHPGVLIWENYCDNWVWNFAGYDWDPHNGEPDPCNPEYTETCFQFNQLLSENEWFYQEPNDSNGTVYWLSIAPIYNPSDYSDPNFYPWGWKTRQPRWNDDAVRIMHAMNPIDGTLWPPDLKIGSQWMVGDPIFWPDPENSWDVAFELTTNQPAYEDDPIPGDLNADKIVNLFDLAILANNWLAVAP